MLGVFHLRANEMDNTYSCLNSITEIQHTKINEKALYTSKDNFIWLEADQIVLQNNERAMLFPTKLKNGLNVISLANNKGRELEIVCINKSGKLNYIDSYGSDCLNQNKTDYFQTISYAKESFESTDPISNKIYLELNKLRVSFKKNVNRNKCEKYISTFKDCYQNFSKLQGKNKIPQTENRYLFVLKELRKTLISQCQVAS